MTDRIRRKDWFDAVVSAKQRIGNDFLLLSKDDYWVAENEPFLADCTTAIFLTKGNAAFSVNMVEYKVEAPAIIISMTSAALATPPQPMTGIEQAWLT